MTTTNAARTSLRDHGFKTYRDTCFTFISHSMRPGLGDAACTIKQGRSVTHVGTLTRPPFESTSTQRDGSRSDTLISYHRILETPEEVKTSAYSLFRTNIVAHPARIRKCRMTSNSADLPK